MSSIIRDFAPRGESMKRIRFSTLFVAAMLLAAAPASGRVLDTEKGRIEVTALTDELNQPWGLDFLPDGRMIVTEKPGRLRIVTRDGKLSMPIAGVPRVRDAGQGGLLDVTLHPDFGENRLVYISYTEPGTDGANATAVARGRLDRREAALSDVEIVFRQTPQLRGVRHYGSRIAFAPDGAMFVTLGDRARRSYRVRAQDLTSHLGKVVRLRPDGSVPADNPFANRSGALPEIWSYGHRNIQGAAIHPVTGKLWTIEHGPRGGDELNIPEPGRNYGWPVVSHGLEYSGELVGSGQKRMPGMEDPIAVWTPVIAPGGMMFYRGDLFSAWKGNLLISGLRSRALVRLELAGRRVVREERLLESLGHRIRDVAVGPEGAVHAVTDERDGKILRLTPAR